MQLLAYFFVVLHQFVNPCFFFFETGFELRLLVFESINCLLENLHVLVCNFQHLTLLALCLFELLDLFLELINFFLGLVSIGVVLDPRALLQLAVDDRHIH